MLVGWLDSALDDLELIDEWLATLEGSVPGLVRERIAAAAASLERLGDIGRPGDVAGTRALTVRGAPYVLIYRLAQEEIEILALYHTSQKR